VPPVVRSYAGKHPRIGRGVFLAETCAVIGDVEIGEESSVWYSTVLRGDMMPIRIGARTSMQDGTVVHIASERFGATVGNDCTIGHAVILHGCAIEDSCLIGMGSTILDGARIGRGCFVGAGALVTPGTDIPPGSLVLGAPARVVRPVNQKEREHIEYAAAVYIGLTRRYLAGDGGSSVG
jgi:carbonic anhydrase/acetyltransferase-like protein (isoleucine patch superfamily)